MSFFNTDDGSNADAGSIGKLAAMMLREVFIVKYNYPKLQSKNGQCCMSVLDNVAKYWISDS